MSEDLDVHLAGVQSGDLEAFERWLAGAEPKLRAGLRSFSGSVDTEAVLQDALLRIWQGASKVRPDGKPNGLLRVGMTIARNLAISEFRRAHRAELPHPEGEGGQREVLAAPMPDPLLRAAIARCRDQLPPKPKRALERRLEGGRSDEELAASLGMSTNTFLQNISRARRLMEAALKEEGIELGLYD